MRMTCLSTMTRVTANRMLSAIEVDNRIFHSNDIRGNLKAIAKCCQYTAGEKGRGPGARGRGNKTRLGAPAFIRHGLGSNCLPGRRYAHAAGADLGRECGGTDCE